MKTSNQSPILSLISLLIIALAANLAHAQDIEQWEEQDTTLVGRISHIEGQLTRYLPDTDDWDVTSRDAPIGRDDLLYSETDSKAEFIMPNNTWIRIGGDTRIHLVTLAADTTEMDIAFGQARFYNKSANTRIEATTPFGRITAPPGAVFDILVQEDGVDIMAIKKNVYFIHNASAGKHDIRAYSSALFADMNKVTATPMEVEYSWKKWNQQMDALWASRMRSKGASANHLPTELHSEAYPLDQHGVWERVYYNGAHYRFWRPVHVHGGWAPFTSGVWRVWHGDHVWIPHEPFGYVTHHYGNWIFTAGFWYWAPPMTRVMVRSHRHHLRIGFGWYPGRVAWIHHGAHVGWIPLAPHEPYYTHRHWGRRSIVLAKRARYRHRSHKYKHHNHAVVIHRSHLYRSGSYQRARIKNIPRSTIRRNFRSTPVLNAAVIKDRRSHRKKDRLNSAQQRRKVYPANRVRNTHTRKKVIKATTGQRSQRDPENRRLRRQRTNAKTEGSQLNRKPRPKDVPKVNRSRKTKDHPPIINRPNRKYHRPQKSGNIRPSEADTQRPRYKNHGSPNSKKRLKVVKAPSYNNRPASTTRGSSKKIERGNAAGQGNRRGPNYRPRNRSDRPSASRNRSPLPGGRDNRGRR